MYEQYCMELGAKAVSKTTFFNVWNSHWCHFLKFRNTGQGKRCKKCAIFDEERVQATTATEKARVSQQKYQHIKEVMMDRAIDMRGNMLGQSHATSTSDGHGKLLKLSIDGMDQATIFVVSLP